MKKAILTLAVLCGIELMPGCEKIHTDELTINNQSGHNVVIEYATVMRPHSIGGFELGWTDIIPTDSSVVVFSAEDNGYTGKMDSEMEIVKWFFGICTQRAGRLIPTTHLLSRQNNSHLFRKKQSDIFSR